MAMWPMLKLVLVVLLISFVRFAVELGFEVLELYNEMDDAADELVRLRKRNELREKAKQREAARPDPALTETLADAAVKGDASVVRALLSHPKLDINADVDGGRGTVLFKVASQPESETGIEVVRVLLKHPKINPNGGSTAWPPLKAAVHAGNRRVANALLDHPRTLNQVHAEGLQCSALKSARAMRNVGRRSARP